MCLNVLIVGFILPLTPVDKKVIKQAHITCKKVYKSCPASITKKENLVYNVICEASND